MVPRLASPHGDPVDPDGALIEVDGDDGTVRILEANA